MKHRPYNHSLYKNGAIIIAAVKFPLLISLFFVSIFLSQQIISNSILNQKVKIDYVEVNHIKYGLFSVDEWKKRLAPIILSEVSKLDLTNTNKAELKKYIEAQLNVLIDKADKKIRESNKGSIKGWFKQRFMNAFVDLDDLKSGTPEYADAIIAEMKKQKTEQKLKTSLKKRVLAYFDKTLQTQDLSQLNSIIAKTKTADIQSARIKLDEMLAKNKEKIQMQTWSLIFLSVVLFILAGLGRQALKSREYIVLLLSLIVLLVAGVATPMIDMEAKVGEMSFVLMGYPIQFTNQILFFQSKSILDVFWILIANKDLQMKIVGILMITFSVVFPLLKMISSIGYYYNFRKARNNILIQFFVLKSGKWSMADVTVVAIFMAYIGFSGIITTQFGKLSSHSQEVVISTVNGTSLQPGFYLFLTYTLLSLFFAKFISLLEVSPQPVQLKEAFPVWHSDKPAQSEYHD